MASLDTTSFSYALKTLWQKERMYKLLYEDNPLAALIPKDENFKGKNKVIGMINKPTPGRSATFATAQANKNPHGGKAFTITRASDYSLASIGGEAIEASQGDAYSLAEAADTEIELATHSIARSLAIGIYRDKAGDIGQVNAGGVSGGVFTLLNVNDITNFEVGFKIKMNPNRTGNAGSLRAGTGTITALDRDAGTVTYTGTITGAAASDYVYIEGDYDAKISGLAAWVPSAAPVGGDNHFGVDRSDDPTRNAGVRFDGSAFNPDEALIKAAMRLGREGGAPSHVFLNHADWTNVELALGTKVQYVDVKAAQVDVGFRGIVLQGPKGPMKLLADQNCPAGVGWMLQLPTWKLESLNQAPHILSLDGNKMLREASADSYEVRIGYYAQVSCRAPGWNARVVMP